MENEAIESNRIVKENNNYIKNMKNYIKNNKDCIDEEYIESCLNVYNFPNGKWPLSVESSLLEQIAVNTIVSEESDNHVIVMDESIDSDFITFCESMTACCMVNRGQVICSYENADDAFNDEKILKLGTIAVMNNKKECIDFAHTFCDAKKLLDGLKSNVNNSLEHKKDLKEIASLFNIAESGSVEFYTVYDKSIKASKILESNDIYFSYLAARVMEYSDSNKLKVWGLMCAPICSVEDLFDLCRKLIIIIQRNFMDSDIKISKRHEKYLCAKDKFNNQLNIVNNLKKELSEACSIYKDYKNSIKNKEQNIKENEDKIEALYKQKEIYENEAVSIHKKYDECKCQKVYKQREAEAFDKIHKSSIYMDKIQYTKESIEEQIAMAEKTISWSEKIADKNAILRKFIHSDKLDKIDNLKIKRDEILKLIEENMKQIITYQKDYNEVLLKKREYEENKSKLLNSYNERINNILNISNDIISKENETLNINKSIIEENEKIDEDLKKYERDRTIINKVFWKNFNKIPWITEKYNRECEKLFYYSLELNKEFLLSSSMIRDKLNNMENIIKSKKDDINDFFESSQYKNYILDIIKTLMMFIPVISISADFANMILKNFEHKKQELLIIKNAEVSQDTILKLSSKFNKTVVYKKKY